MLEIIKEETSTKIFDQYNKFSILFIFILSLLKLVNISSFNLNENEKISQQPKPNENKRDTINRSIPIDSNIKNTSKKITLFCTYLNQYVKNVEKKFFEILKNFSKEKKEAKKTKKILPSLFNEISINLNKEKIDKQELPNDLLPHYCFNHLLLNKSNFTKRSKKFAYTQRIRTKINTFIYYFPCK